MSRFVRNSPYRHVFAPQPKRDKVYEGIKLTRSAWDSNFMSANSDYIAISWAVGGGGAVGLMKVGDYGRHDTVNLFTGHKGAVLDVDFSPFNNNILATASEDCFAKIWTVPEGGLTENISEAAQVLRGHKRKIGNILFHPTAENVVTTTAQDYLLKLWDITTGEEKASIGGFGNIIQSQSWNYDGSILATYCKDKKVRLVDPRGGDNAVVAEVESHLGTKGARALWAGKNDLVLSFGFGRGAQREFSVYDPKNMSTPLVKSAPIDNSSGVLCPFYDEDSNLCFVAGKGDGNIRMYEITPGADAKGIVYLLGQYGSNQSGSAFTSLPRRSCNVNENEIIRIYKITGTALQPLHFTVPRKSELFQDDIFPHCRGDTPSLTSEQFFAGENAVPQLVDLENGFVAKAPKAVAFDKTEAKKELTEAEVRAALKEANNRIAYLEAELAKAQAK
eukprot:TRINITY_DN10519_c0_g1_i1.p1 TRINITY_DN10519_c0_g1~~TRINITY_DN10519_c0_g1_i1.p1  ORF type:complete len:447 (+),score=142.00 TRINITY_DN10519_c0_g1_i1:268-1608(+)